MIKKTRYREYNFISNNLADLCAYKGINIQIPDRLPHILALYAAIEHLDPTTYDKYKDLPLEEIRVKPIDLLEITIRASNRLKGAGITTIGNLLDITQEEVLCIKGLGVRSYYEITANMRLLGFEFHGNVWRKAPKQAVRMHFERA